MTGERAFIRKLRQRFPDRSPVQTGIGDDGAVLDVANQQSMVVVTDMLLDGVHFDLQKNSPDLVGRKAIAVNLSDLAAMACWPTAAFVSVAIPKSLPTPDAFLDSLYDGMQSLTDKYQFTLAGGDTNSWDGAFAINVCLTGMPFNGGTVLRSGAFPGDELLVTGALGGSLPSGRHLSFEPQLHLARWLVNEVKVHAMMDISDGLSIDLHRMMEASSTGAVLDSECIPISSNVASDLAPQKRLQHALSDGEDFELLIAVSADAAKRLTLQECPHRFIRVGQVTEGGDVLLQSNDRRVPLNADGWQHL